jgi:hypothetical protein
LLDGRFLACNCSLEAKQGVREHGERRSLCLRLCGVLVHGHGLITTLWIRTVSITEHVSAKRFPNREAASSTCLRSCDRCTATFGRFRRNPLAWACRAYCQITMCNIEQECKVISQIGSVYRVSKEKLIACEVLCIDCSNETSTGFLASSVNEILGLFNYGRSLSKASKTIRRPVKEQTSPYSRWAAHLRASSV